MSRSFTILGSYSGRNAGDAAILASIMKTLADRFGSDTRFEVPTTHPAFISKHYSDRFNVKPISVMPWTGSIRLLGIPTLRSIARTETTLITDGIIFDFRLFNPLFNFLITLGFLVSWANTLGKSIICYNVGVGPLRSRVGRAFARYVCNRSRLVIVRDADSRALLQEIGVTNPIHLEADAVFDNWGVSKREAEKIIDSQGALEAADSGKLLGVNVTRYLDAWLSASERAASPSEFVPMLASVLGRLWMDHGVVPLIVITQHMDYPYGERLQRMVESTIERQSGIPRRPGIVSNTVYNNHEILGVASRCRMFVGMRLHSLIIAAKAGTPVVGMVYAPKVRSFLKQLGTPELAYGLANLDADVLETNLLNAWRQTDRIRATQQSVVENLEQAAVEASDLVANVLLT